jgi:isopenicillin N synthase-like dioxygenase
MDPTEPDCLTQLRFLHYFPSEDAVGSWRAGVHTDIGCLTLLFQRTGEDGLEICPGRESSDTYAVGSEFTPLSAETGPIVVNIGDMLSRPLLILMLERQLINDAVAWSDDRLKANFHRVRAKEVGKSPERFSIAYFNTGRKNFLLQGPQKK